MNKKEKVETDPQDTWYTKRVFKSYLQGQQERKALVQEQMVSCPQDETL